jgi:hypothetical protein
MKDTPFKNTVLYNALVKVSTSGVEATRNSGNVKSL